MRFREGPVRYEDYKGQTASDISDDDDLLGFLRKEGIASDQEQLAGFRVCYAGPFREGDFGVLVYLFNEDQLADNKTLKRARAVDVTISADRFFKSFKRFDLLQVRNGLDVEDCIIEGPYYD